MSKQKPGRGRPSKGEDRYVGISGRVPSVVKEAVATLAKEEGRSASQQLARIVAEWLREHGRLK